MDTPITRAEHEEFRKRLEDENHRQNRRIELLEKSTQQFHSLATSVEKLALNMENMVKIQGQQGERLEELESRDGKKWRKAMGYITAGIIGAVVGYIFKQIGM